MENQEQTKKCIHCGRELPISSFNKCSRSADGLQSYCKDCHREENAKARARRKSEIDGVINRVSRAKGRELMTTSLLCILPDSFYLS